MREFKIKFVKGQGKQGKQLNGAGTISISEDDVVLTRSEVRGWLWSVSAETVTVKLNQIANVAENKELKCLQFSEYPAGRFSGTPENVYQFFMVEKSEKDELLELLPKQMSDEVTLETEFMDKLKQLTPYAFFTILIVALCVLVYIAMGVFDGYMACFKPNLITLFRFGADYGPLVADGEWYRLITCAFVHIGFVHILFNMAILWQIGHFVERLYGNLLFLIVYLGSAVAGSLTSLTMKPMVISAGASGAIFGLYGALLAYILRRRGSIPMHMVASLRNSAFVFIAFTLFYGLQPGIDNWCHLGGLVGGFFLGVIVAPPFESDERTRNSALMAVLGAAIVAAGSYVYLSSNPTKLDQEKIGSILAEWGTICYNGNSELRLEKNADAAVGFFDKALKYNNPVAIYYKGFFYYNGIGVEKDEQKALELFKQSAEMGDPDAQTNYGSVLYYKKNDQKGGFEWLKKACANGSQNARYFLACIYYDGDENVEPDKEFAVSEFKELADSGFQPAIDLLKKLEHDAAHEGESVPEDEPAPVEKTEQGDN